MKQRDMAAIDKVLAVNENYHGPYMPDGVGDRESWRRAVAMYRAAFPDSHVTYEQFVTSSDIVVGRWIATRTSPVNA